LARANSTRTLRNNLDPRLTLLHANKQHVASA
jgi:hypothetical protein